MLKKFLLAAVCMAASGWALADAPPAAPAPNANTMPGIAQVSQDQLLQLQADKDARFLLLDVRTPKEYSAGHVPGAVNIPYEQVADHLGEIPKDEEVVLYCHSGRRAGIAAETLEAHGYTKLAHLTGDMQAWADAGKPQEAVGETPAK
jgi:phage shock protein E